MSRRNNIFRSFHDVPNKSPAFLIMDSIRNYQLQLKPELTTPTNKANLKKFNATERTRIPDTMQRRSRGPSLLSQGNSRYHY